MNTTVKTQTRLADRTGSLPNDVQRIVDWYESLTPESLLTIGTIYSPDCFFRDPFREIQGLSDLRTHFSTLFSHYQKAGFRITNHIADGSRVALYWTFWYERRWSKGEVQGSFLLELGADGRILRHEDFWDVSEQVYEKLPLVGHLFRWLKLCLGYMICPSQSLYREQRSENESPLRTTLSQTHTVVDLFLARAMAEPKGLIHKFRGKDGRWVGSTLSEARKRVLAAAAGFRRLGLEPGDGVAIIAGSRPEWMEAELAVLHQGGYVVGLEPHARPEELSARIFHSGVRGLVVENRSFLDRFLPGTLAGVSFVVSLDEVPSSGQGLTCDSWDNMTRTLTNPYKSKLLANPDDLAALVYTSGSTGEPKAIRFTHRQILTAVQAIGGVFPELSPGDHTLSWLPLAHQFQRISNWVALGVGAVIHFVDDPRQVINRAREVHPTVFIGVPRFYEKLVDGFSERIESFPGGLISRFLKRALAQAKRNREGETKSFFRAWESWFWDILLFRPFRNLLGGKVKILFTGSAPMAPRLLEFIQAAGMNLLEGYAMSENTVPVAVNRTGAKRLGSVGQVLLPNEVQLAEDGEILVRGPGLFSGYWKSETPEGWFTEDGFFRTGDLGWMDDKGFLFLKGRKDEVIKTSTGRKISPSRLETVYGASPYFDRVVVIGNNRPGPLALLWLKKNKNPSSMEISHELTRLGTSLDPHERVHHFVLPKEDLDIAQGTLTPSLKLKRRVIEDRFRSEGGILVGAGEPEPIKTPASRVSWFEALKRFMAPVKLFFVVHVIERIFLRRLSREFYLLIGGAIHFQALSSAVRFDLFTLLDTHGPLKEDQIAERLGLVEQPAKILLLSLVATGLLKKSGDQYRNSWVAQHYLSQRNPKNISKIILWQHFINYRPMYHFHESLIKNTNVGLQLLDGTERTLYERLTHHPDLEMIFQEAMGQISVQANDLLSQFPGFQSVHRLLDVGGGNGSNIIQLASRHPHLKATVFDSASVCAIARTNIHQKGLSDRLGTHEGDCFNTPFPTGYDAILFCHFFTIWSKEHNLELLKKTYASLRPGGRVLIFNMMQDNSRSGPLSSAMGSPYFLTLATGEGMLYTWNDYVELFQKAGFKKIRTHVLPKDHGIIEGTRGEE